MVVPHTWALEETRYIGDIFGVAIRSIAQGEQCWYAHTYAHTYTHRHTRLPALRWSMEALRGHLCLLPATVV